MTPMLQPHRSAKRSAAPKRFSVAGCLAPSSLEPVSERSKRAPLPPPMLVAPPELAMMGAPQSQGARDAAMHRTPSTRPQAPSMPFQRSPRSMSLESLRVPFFARPSFLWMVLALFAWGPLASPAVAQEAKDQVTHYNPRTERVLTIAGTVTVNSLGGLEMTTADDKTVKFDADRVLRVVFGDVPQSLKDGRTYWERKDYTNALAQYRLAASDGDAREVVCASARIAAVRALLKLGAKDAAQLTECAAEADRFLEEFSDGRDVPEAMALKGRALWLSGKAKEATASYLALYEKGRTNTPGFSKAQSTQAGLSAAWTSLDADDTGKARELFTACKLAFEAAAEEALPTERAKLLGNAAIAETGEGFCLLASGDPRGAKNYFERMLGKADFAPQGRFAATLGLGEALLADNQAAEAQIHLARASALDPSGRDRTARAMLSLARCLQKIGTQEATLQASVLITKVKGAYGDTPSAFHAAK